MFPSEVLKLSSDCACERFLSVWKLFLFGDSFPGAQVPVLKSCLFSYLLSFVVPYCREVGLPFWNSGVQQAFCRSCSICRWIFDVSVGREGDFIISFLYHLKFSPHDFILYLNGVNCTFHIFLGKKPMVSWCCKHQGKHDSEALDGTTLHLGRPRSFLPLWIFLSFNEPFVLANVIHFSWPADFHLCLISFLWS